MRPVEVESDFAAWPKLTPRGRKLCCPLDGCNTSGWYSHTATMTGWMARHANVEHDRCDGCGRWVPRPAKGRHRCPATKEGPR